MKEVLEDGQMMDTANGEHETEANTEEEDVVMHEVEAGARKWLPLIAAQNSSDGEAGRGNPTSTMLWSSIKRAGQKRLLEEQPELEEYDYEES